MLIFIIFDPLLYLTVLIGLNIIEYNRSNMDNKENQNSFSSAEPVALISNGVAQSSSTITQGEHQDNVERNEVTYDNYKSTQNSTVL